jgi:hypothetical protein
VRLGKERCTHRSRVVSPDPIVLSVNAQERLQAKWTSPENTTAHVMTCTIMVTKLNKDSNYMLLVANGALQVLVADVLDVGNGYKGLRSTFKTSP